MKCHLFQEGEINKVLVLTKERPKCWPEPRFSQRRKVFTRLGFGEASSHGGPSVEVQAGRVGGREGGGGRGGGGREGLDLRAGLLVGRVAHNRVCSNVQVQASHDTR